ncbi:MAG TPA: hypothetical protein VJ279_02980, partial [Hanamia sp.]|nr:hypothetical protein [Hanamia sp.]
KLIDRNGFPFNGAFGYVNDFIFHLEAIRLMGKGTKVYDFFKTGCKPTLNEWLGKANNFLNLTKYFVT